MECYQVKSAREGLGVEDYFLPSSTLSPLKYLYRILGVPGLKSHFAELLTLSLLSE